MPVFSKEERLTKIWERLSSAPSPRCDQEAFQLLFATIREVEDELTEIPFDPESWRTDGRIYPPREDSIREVPGRSDLVRYRSRGHNTFIRSNGAIEVRDTAGKVVFTKPGSDGKGIEFAG